MFKTMGASHPTCHTNRVPWYYEILTKSLLSGYCFTGLDRILCWLFFLFDSFGSDPDHPRVFPVINLKNPSDTEILCQRFLRGTGTELSDWHMMSCMRPVDSSLPPSTTKSGFCGAQNENKLEGDTYYYIPHVFLLCSYLFFNVYGFNLGAEVYQKL